MATSLYDEMKKQKQPATTSAFRQADQKASQPQRPPSQASAYATPGNPRTNPRQGQPATTTAFRQADQQASKPKAPPSGASAYAQSLWAQANKPPAPKASTPPPAPKSWYEQLRESDTSPGRFMTGVSPYRLLSGAVGVAGDLIEAGRDYLTDTPPAVVLNDAARAAQLAGSVVGKVEQGKYMLASPEERARIDAANERARRERAGQVYGVDFGPNWERSDYNPANDPGIIDPDTGRPSGQNWRQDLAPILTTPEEWQSRINVQDANYNPMLQDWTSRAMAAASTLTAAEYQAWLQANPRPSSIFQSNQEYIKRRDAAPTGYGYQPFGSGLYEKPTLPSPASNQPGGIGGSGRGYGWGGYGGGGGYYGGGYEQAKSFYNALTNWRVLEVQGG